MDERSKDGEGLVALIGRLEKATEGSSELDEAIAATLVGATAEKQADGRISYYRGNMWVSIHPIRLFTSSIDAALSLVPEGWVRAVDATMPESGTSVSLYNNLTKPDVESNHRSEPIATCIAALKARLPEAPQGADQT